VGGGAKSGRTTEPLPDAVNTPQRDAEVLHAPPVEVLSAFVLPGKAVATVGGERRECRQALGLPKELICTRDDYSAIALKKWKLRGR
jgi:hypothetical protein